MDGVSTFNFVDIVALGFILLGTAVGYRRGFSGEIARLAGLLASLLLVLVFYRPVAQQILEHTRLQQQASQAVAFGLVLVASLVVMIALRLILKPLIKFACGQVIDKTGGLVAGMLKSSIAVLIIFLMMNTWPHDYLNRQFGEESMIGRRVIHYAPGIRANLEEMSIADAIRRKLDASREKVDQLLEEHTRPQDEATNKEKEKKRWFSRRKVE